MGGKLFFSKSIATSNALTLPYASPYFINEDGCKRDSLEFLSGEIVQQGNYALNFAFTGKDGTCSLSGNTINSNVLGTSFNDAFELTKLTSTELVLKINGTYSGQSAALTLYFTR